MAVVFSLQKRMPYAKYWSPYIFKDTTPENIVVFSDSLSCLEAIKHYQIKNPFICEILNLLHQLSLEFNKNIHLCWIPSHVDIKGNEAADLAAKSGLNLSPDQITPIKIPHTDLKSLVAKSCTDLWQRYWNEQCSDLKNLHPVLPYRPTYTGLTQHEAWVYYAIAHHRSYAPHTWVSPGAPSTSPTFL